MSIFNASSLLFFTFIPYTYSYMNAKLYNTVHICKQNRQKVTRNVFYEQITVYSETAHLKN